MDDTKRQVLPSGLWVVATPIGNLSDITARAREALELADTILCEDTRRTLQLLSGLGITNRSSKRLERLDAHSKSSKIDAWVRNLTEGLNVALVTDAGTPSISDPGAALVAGAIQAGVRIVPIPGASSVVTLLSVAGFQSTAFTFLGFFPRKLQEQKRDVALAAAQDLCQVYVWFESPNRILDTLEFFKSFDSSLQMVAGKELTKRYEKIFYGNAEQVSIEVKKEIEAVGALGEWCIAVEFQKKSSEKADYEREFDENRDWVKALKCMLNSGVPASEASVQVSQEFDIPKRVIYEISLRLSGKKSTKKY